MTVILVRVGAVLAVWAASTASAWPQIRNGTDLFGQAITPADLSPRGLPAVGAGAAAMGMGTLPIPRVSRRREGEGAAGFGKRRLLLGNLHQDHQQQGGEEDKEKRAASGSGFPSAPIQRPGLLTLPVVHVERPSLDKRGIETKLENRSDVAYYAQLNIGNPPQTVFAQLDTGSFELWVNPDCSSLQLPDMRFCQAIGKYDPTTSSSSKVSNKSNELRYGIGSANITYVLDDINVPPSQRTMKGVQFGVAKTSKDQFAGILGIGHGQGVNTAYKNFIDQLADQGITNTKAYSVALGSKSDKSGVVVFGGVDTAKYSGALAPLPIIPANKSPDGVARFWLTLQSMQHTSSRGKTTDLSTKPMPVFLDTGATLSLLPPDLSAAVAQSFGATKMDASGFYTVDCELAKRNGTLDFNFDGVTIHVPYKEIMREIQSTPPSCYLGIMPSTSFTLLGDTFLRSAYVVFDISNNMTFMAPYSNCGSKPVNIEKDTVISTIIGTCAAQKGDAAVDAVGDGSVSNGNKQNSKGSGAARTPNGGAGWSLWAGGILTALAFTLVL